MNRLEYELRNAMKRKEPPPGFDGRVLARTAGGERNASPRLFGRRALAWGLAGVLCIMLCIAGIEYRKAREEMADGEAAKQQLMLALRIAGDQMQFVRSKITRP
jgi:hypothetical protein